MKSGDFEVDDGMVVSRARYEFLKDQNKELIARLEDLAHSWETNQCVNQRTFIRASQMLRDTINAR